MNKPEQVPPSEEEEDEDEEEEGCQQKKDFEIEEQNSVKQQHREELLLLPCKEVNLGGSAMIKEKPREKKKTTNGNGNNNGGGATGGGTGSGSASMEIKTEPADRERENEIVKEEPAVLPDETVSMSADKSAENSPIPETKNTPCSQPDICMPEAVKAEEGTLVENPVNPVKNLKNEEAEPEFGTDCPDMGETVQNVLPMLTSAATEPLLDGVQPLASNVINKQPGTMEAQYMQQQSQIFVFSTALANKSAESVIQGQYTSIIAYHCAQPRTKKYLEKHPLKMNQFSRQNPAQWLNNLAQIKQKGGGPGMGPGQGPIGPMGGPMKFMGMNRGGAPPAPPPPPAPNAGNPVKNNMMMDMGHPMGIPPNRMPMWNQCVQGCSGPMSMKGPMSSNVDGPGMMAGSPNSNPMMQAQGTGQMPSLADFTDTDPMGLGTHHSLAGVKVPDENLTPQQRQHREEQLATLRKMQQMLFPEHHSPGEQPPPGPVQCPVSVSTSVPGAPVPQCPPNSVAGPPGPTDLDEVIPLASDPGDMMMPHHKNPPSMAAQAEWQKMQLQFYEERKKKGTCVTPENSGGIRTGSRTQGPPPPYHQTTRSASVPIAMPSPNPSSPNNTTSNLSLPSPRTCSGLNSPAGRHPPGPSPTAPLDSPGHTLNPSNPGTPVSLSTHLSPKKDKHNGSSEFSPTSSQQSPDGMYCRTLQTIAQQKQQPQSQQPGQQQPQQQASSISKEPNLMPVPSPQQIQYLNAFEGQELTIQKQPNTSLKESSIMSPTLPPTSLESVLPTSGADITPKVSGPLTPSSLEMSVNRAVFSGTSPSPGTVAADKNRPVVCQNAKTDSRFSCNSPQMPDSITSSRFPMMGSSPGLSNNFMQQQPSKPGPHFLEISPNGKSNCAVGNNDGGIKDQGSGNYQCVGQDNVPLNPNGVTRMGMGLGNGVKTSSFDPISSLAQMSQQLTNVTGSPGGQSGNMMHPGVMPFNNPPGNMHLMQMNDMGVCQEGIRMGNPQMTGHPHSFSPGSNGSGRMVPCPGNNNSVSPKPGLMQPGPSYPGPMGQRMMNRPPVSNSYNGANIQVKPSAPNTIQYLPTRTQTGPSAGPRGPPSLDFLQRFSNPLSNLDAKVPTHNLQYFPNNYQQNNSVNTSDMNMLGNINCGGMNQGIGMIRGAVRGGSGGMLRVGMPQVGFGGGDGMFPGAPSGPGPGNCQMFVPGGKGSPGMGMGVPPDASQPLPPSMGQSNSFKNSSFIGPTTSDPNYAQQFHNFQQQLYATNTRSQMSNQAMGANQQFFVPK